MRDPAAVATPTASSRRVGPAAWGISAMPVVGCSWEYFEDITVAFRRPSGEDIAVDLRRCVRFALKPRESGRSARLYFDHEGSEAWILVEGACDLVGPVGPLEIREIDQSDILAVCREKHYATGAGLRKFLANRGARPWGIF
jgi:hypothetical protein